MTVLLGYHRIHDGCLEFAWFYPDGRMAMHIFRLRTT